MDGPDAIVIREASPEVVGALVGFDPMAQAGDATRRTATKAWVSAGFTLVAESGAGIVGYVATLPGHLFGRDFVAMLIVHPGHRRRGVGRALLEAAVKRAAGDRVFTSTNTSNAPMKALLVSSGWLNSGTLDGLDPGDPEEFYYIDRQPYPRTDFHHRSLGKSHMCRDRTVGLMGDSGRNQVIGSGLRVVSRRWRGIAIALSREGSSHRVVESPGI